MIDPFQVATQGLGPGYSTFTVASQGFGFEIEVIVRPVTGGGGYVADQRRYEIIVRVKYKGKVWEERRETSGLIGKTLEKVIASFKTAKTNTIELVARINNIVNQKITIFAKRK